MRAKDLCVAALIFAASAHAASGRTELAQGWKLRSMSPRAALDAPLLKEAAGSQANGEWMPVARMLAMVHDVLLAAGRVIARTNALTDIERRVAFPDAKLTVQVKDGALSITTDKFARTVTLEGDANGEQSGWLFEDNYFDLMPGEVKTVRILGNHSQGRVTVKPWYSPHSASVPWRR